MITFSSPILEKFLYTTISNLKEIDNFQILYAIYQILIVKVIAILYKTIYAQNVALVLNRI